MKRNWIWSTLRLTEIVLATLTQGPDVASAATKKCLFVSPYHQGYAWWDGVERGLRSVLEGRCVIRQFDMSTKRKKKEILILSLCV